MVDASVLELRNARQFDISNLSACHSLYTLLQCYGFINKQLWLR